MHGSATGYTAREIARAKKVHKTSVIRRAEKENWPYNKGRNRSKRYILTGLPSDVQTDLVRSMDKQSLSVAPSMIPQLAPEAALEAANRIMGVEEYSFSPSPRPSPAKGEGEYRGPESPSPRPSPVKGEGDCRRPDARGEGIDDVACHRGSGEDSFAGQILNFRFESSKPSWTDEAVGLSLDTVRDPRVMRICRILQEAQKVPIGVKKRDWIEQVAIKHDTTFQSVYTWIRKYDQRGLAGLRHTKSTKETPKAWSPEAVEWWTGLCLKKEHRRIDKNRLYAILREEAAKMGWQIGSYSSALWWFRKKASPQLLALQRGGLRALDNTLPPILRDYSDLAPFQILVGDQHRFDFWVVDDETGRVFRPEGYFWQDLRTRAFYGGAVDTKYDAYLIGLALRMGLKIFGPFDQIYTDWGMPERAKYIMGILKDIRALGMEIGRETDVPFSPSPRPSPARGEGDCCRPDARGEGEFEDDDSETINPSVLLPGTHRLAIVRNAKAKMMESTFGVFEDILTSVFRVPGHVKDLGGIKEENEVDQEEIERFARAGKLLTFWEFAETMYRAMDYYNKDRAHRGVLREWAWKPKPKSATPMDCLKACHLAGWKPVRVSDQAIDLIFLPRTERIVDRGRIIFCKEVYEHEALVDLPKSEKVEVRYDPLDPEWIAVFRGGEYLCLARQVEYSSMADQDLASRKIEEKARRRKGFLVEYHRLTSTVPDFLEYSRVPAIEKAAALITKDQRDKAREQALLVAPMSAEEIEANIAQMEAYEPKRIFTTARDRYSWLVEQEAAGVEPSGDDRAFMNEYWAGLDETTRAYWEVYFEEIGLKKQAIGERR
jgi:putative transposase